MDLPFSLSDPETRQHILPRDVPLTRLSRVVNRRRRTPLTGVVGIGSLGSRDAPVAQVVGSTRHDAVLTAVELFYSQDDLTRAVTITTSCKTNLLETSNEIFRFMGIERKLSSIPGAIGGQGAILDSFELLIDSRPQCAAEFLGTERRWIATFLLGPLIAVVGAVNTPANDLRLVTFSF